MSELLSDLLHHLVLSPSFLFNTKIRPPSLKKRVRLTWTVYPSTIVPKWKFFYLGCFPIICEIDHLNPSRWGHRLIFTSFTCCLHAAGGGGSALLSASEDLHAWSIYRQNLNSDFTDSALGSQEKAPLPYGNFHLRESTVHSIFNNPR